jgi:uncharacterized membrane protein
MDPNEREQRRQILRSIEDSLREKFPAARPYVDVARQFEKIYEIIREILFIPVLVIIEIVIVSDFMQELKAVPRDYYQLFTDIIIFLILGLIIVLVGKDAPKMVVKIKDHIKKLKTYYKKFKKIKE